MSVSNKHLVRFVFCVLLIAAGLLLGGFPIPHAVNPYIGDMGGVGQQYATFIEPPIQASEPQPEVSGALRGMVVDESDAPVQGVEVELIPANKTGDARWYATKHEWTNGDGLYRFNYADPGEYFVAVQKRSAPDGRHPFAGAYYPAADDESAADRVLIAESSSNELQPMRLHRLETVTLKVRVAFEDGTSPRWSNMLFHNLSYPDQAVIGDEAPGIADGQGQFTLPKGFEYYARAKVDCDSGARIETRESRPVQQITVEEGFNLEELVFTIPGPACKLWSPK